jgi:hypothetical protein
MAQLILAHLGASALQSCHPGSAGIFVVVELLEPGRLEVAVAVSLLQESVGE